MLRLWGREKSIALDWKARLVLSGQGTQDKENKAVCAKAVSIKGQTLGRSSQLSDHLLQVSVQIGQTSCGH